ncbi:hypothetical protein, partial [Tritonibacter sp. SIMBA_163]|uniref:hypothetical protein n=1 Tax=Tritonibacter sp. SIMBA_163 TaxID=3080868 RepID=UPI0039804324
MNDVDSRRRGQDMIERFSSLATRRITRGRGLVQLLGTCFLALFLAGPANAQTTFVVEDLAVSGNERIEP